MVNSKKTQHKSITQILLILLLIVVFSGLVIYGVKGIFSRYAQDDYCYGYHVKTFGFIDTQLSSYWQINEYNGNRYSATLSHSIIEVLGGVKLSPMIPASLIILWGIGLYFVVVQVIPNSDQQNRNIIWFLIVGFVIFFTFYLAPNLYEILYWNPGQQAYLMPMVLYTFIAALMLWFAKQKTLKVSDYFIIGFLCFFAGGFSETPTLWFLVVLLITGLFSLMVKNFPFNHIFARKILFCAVAATVLSVLVLALSPANGSRLSDDSHLRLFEIVKTALIYGFDFLFNTIRSAPIPYIVLAAFGYFAASFVKQGHSSRMLDCLKIILFGAIALYCLSAATMFPTVFATGVYPGYRALTPIHFSLVIYCVLLGWWSERFLKTLLPVLKISIPNLVLTSLLGILLMVYSSRAVSFVLSDFNLYKARAQGWDQREAMIFDAKERGETDLEVPAFDSVYGITELKTDAGNWVNQCAAKYYEVDSITAIENYGGIGTLPIGK